MPKSLFHVHLLACLVLSVPVAMGQDWPNWLGPNYNNVATTDTQIRRTYDAQLQPIWKHSFYKSRKETRRDGGNALVVNGTVYTFHMQEATREVERVSVPISGKKFKQLSNGTQKTLTSTNSWENRSAFDSWLAGSGIPAEEHEKIKALSSTTEKYRYNHLTTFNIETGEQLWQAKWPGDLNKGWFGGENHATMSIVDGVVYLVESDGTLHARSAKDGSGIWQSKEKVWGAYAGHNSSPLVHGGRIFISTQHGQLAFSCEDGSLLWATDPKTSGIISTMDNSNVIYTNAEGKDILLAPSLTSPKKQCNLYALDPATGEVLWHIVDASSRYMTPVVSGNRLIALRSNAKTKPGLGIYNLDTTPPERITMWEHKGMNAGNTGQTCSTPAVSADRCWFGTHTGLYCFSITDGKQLWANEDNPIGNYANPILSGDLLLSYVMNKGWGVFDAQTGELLHLNSVPGTHKWHPVGSPTLSNGFLLIKSKATGLLCYDLRP